MDVKRGSVVLARAGREKGGFFAVLSVEGAYALIADGKARKIAAPKKKKLMHLAVTTKIVGEQELQNDNQLRTAIAGIADKNSPPATLKEG